MSNDLIRREKVIKEISGILADVYIKGFITGSVSFDGLNRRIQECLSNLPADYDVDKVVEQLEEKINNTADTVSGISARMAFGKAIEIVKAGVISGGTE